MICINKGKIKNLSPCSEDRVFSWIKFEVIDIKNEIVCFRSGKKGFAIDLNKKSIWMHPSLMSDLP